MDWDSPQHPFAAALRCIGAGHGVISAAAALVIALAGAWLNLWQPANDTPIVSAGLLALLFCVHRSFPRRAAIGGEATDSNRNAENRLLMVWLAVLGAEYLGVRLACCAGALAAAGYLAWAGWRLIHVDANFLLWAAG